MKINTGLLLLLPSLLALAILQFVPIGYAVWISFFERSLFDPTMTWVGVRNYSEILSDPDYWNSVINGTIFAVATVALQIIVGTGLAVLLNERFRLRSLALSIAVVPYVMPIICVALIWKWLLDETVGIFNYFLTYLGIIQKNISFFGDPSWAMPSLILVNVWQFSSFVCLMVLARLQMIPSSYYEAAKVDGAGAIRRFRDITLPSIKTIVILLILLRSMWMFTKFDVIWLLTRGGPIGTTTTMPVIAYLVAFSGYALGKGSAVAVTMFIIMIAVGFTYLKVFKSGKQMD